MLVFDNKKHYDKLIAEGFEKYPNKRDLMVLCQEWFNQGIDTREKLLNEMIAFCKKWNCEFNSAKNENLLYDVLNSFEKSQKNPPSFEFNKNIIIYKNEINRLLSIEDKNYQKIGFIMICLAKWRNVNFVYLNSGSSISLKIIYELAGIKATSKEQKTALFYLNITGFLDVQLKPLLKCFIPCIEETGDIAMQFDIDDNMIYNWNYLVMPHCARCDNPFVKRCNKQKYCPECAKIIKNEQNKSYMDKN